MAATISKALEKKQPKEVRFVDSDQQSGEAMAVSGESIQDVDVQEALRNMYEWGAADYSGKTFVIENKPDTVDVLTKDLLQRLCPSISERRLARGTRGGEANELDDFQDYSLTAEDDGYAEEQSAVPTEVRMKGEAQHRRYSVKGQLPTCWITLQGGMGRALIDTGSQLNVMRLSTARALNVYITMMDQSMLPTELQQGMVTANGGMDPFVGTAYSVPVAIGGVVVPTHFRITRNLQRAILLGTPWCAAARLRIEFDTFGRTLCFIKSTDGRREISFVGCDPAPTANALPLEDQGKV
ncbi:hypothetical protein COCCADRAFT_112311 [Bipolaris zeicola 26-R-13]|uniref:Uncharacterized protein n=1 Tax=Cochliobolus carbonum (strain 26-R-13) TaxID=930089 RepID=W6Y824_COCC2|nr:uncharacterized protein COCCADRAFT_112311 [Bipolaris zeicola 26-R-13]EUC27206.1 hypothetical protein COCCADRAFT_112311 [Bipolaris zeicola 26-R-13]